MSGKMQASKKKTTKKKTAKKKVTRKKPAKKKSSKKTVVKRKKPAKKTVVKRKKPAKKKATTRKKTAKKKARRKKASSPTVRRKKSAPALGPEETVQIALAQPSTPAGGSACSVADPFERRETQVDAADLFGATKLGQAEEVRRLLQNGIDPDLTDDPRGEHREVVAFLCQNEDLGQVDLEGMKVGRTACHMAAVRGSVDILRTLIEGGCDLDHRDHAGETPLMLAARAGFAQLVRMLVQAGAKVDARDLRGTTALLRAADAGHIEVVRTLIDAHADVDACDGNERTPLMVSAAAVHEQTVRLLLETEADLCLRDSSGADALCAAVSAIESVDPGVPSPFQAVSQERILPIVALLVESGALDEPDGMGVRPSRRAQERGHERIAQILMTSGS